MQDPESTPTYVRQAAHAAHLVALLPKPDFAKHRLRRVPDDCPQAVVALVEACTEADPGASPSAAAVQAALDAAAPQPQQAAPPAGSGPGAQAVQPDTPPQTEL